MQRKCKKRSVPLLYLNELNNGNRLQYCVLNFTVVHCI